MRLESIDWLPLGYLRLDQEFLNLTVLKSSGQEMTELTLTAAFKNCHYFGVTSVTFPSASRLTRTPLEGGGGVKVTLTSAGATVTSGG